MNADVQHFKFCGANVMPSDPNLPRFNRIRKSMYVEYHVTWKHIICDSIENETKKRWQLMTINKMMMMIFTYNEKDVLQFYSFIYISSCP